MPTKDTLLEETFEVKKPTEDNYSPEFPDNAVITENERTLEERLRNDKAFHKMLYDEIKSRFDLSHNYMSRKHEQLDKNYPQYYAYIDLTKEDKARQTKARADADYPGTASLIWPLSFAKCQSILMYLMGVFTAVRPLMPVDGVKPEDMKTAPLMESVLEYQNTSQYVRDVLLMYHWLQDIIVGNYGAIKVGWINKKITRTQMIPILDPVTGQITEYRKMDVPIVGYEGNQAVLIGHYDFYPDPRVPLHRINDGEYVGSLYEHPRNFLTRMQEAGVYFNIDLIPDSFASVIPRNSKRSSVLENIHGTPMQPRLGSNNRIMSSNESGTGPKKEYVEIAEMEIDCIPRDWDLSDSTSPEKWVFAIANDQTIIRAEPLGNTHGRFSYIPLEYFSDGHWFTNRGIMEMLAPLQEGASWLYNSRRENVRLMLNGEYVVDPSMIDMNSFKITTPGRLIFKSELYYGVPVEGNAIYQLQKTDTTANHLTEIRILDEYADRIIGSSPGAIQGVPSGGRKSAREATILSSAAINRLKEYAEIIDCYAIKPWSELKISNTQQYLTEERFYKILGHNAFTQGLDPQKSGLVRVAPMDIIGEYNYRKRDGSLPLDKYQEIEYGLQALQIIGSQPELLQTFDVVNIFRDFVAVKAGARNIDEYRRKNVNVDMQDDEKVARAFQAGNAVPIQGPQMPQSPFAGI